MYISKESSDIIIRRLVQASINKLGTQSEFGRQTGLNSNLISQITTRQTTGTTRALLSCIVVLGYEDAFKLIQETVQELQDAGYGTVEEFFKWDEYYKTVRFKRLGHVPKKPKVRRKKVEKTSRRFYAGTIS
jgi:hypothetical protein